MSTKRERNPLEDKEDLEPSYKRFRSTQIHQVLLGSDLQKQIDTGEGSIDLHGTYQIIHARDLVQTVEYYHGTLHGEVKNHTIGDHKIYYGQFLQGKRQGPFKYQDLVTKVYVTTKYLDGLENGERIVTEVLGSRARSRNHRLDQNQKVTRTDMVNGQRHGLEVVTVNGYITEQTEYYQDKLHGQFNLYKHEICIERKSYKHGSAHGIHEKFNSLSNRIYYATYVDGLLDGIVAEYDDIGLTRETTYHQGQAHGTARVYGRTKTNIVYEAKTFEYRADVFHGPMIFRQPDSKNPNRIEIMSQQYFINGHMVGKQVTLKGTAFYIEVCDSDDAKEVSAQEYIDKLNGDKVALDHVLPKDLNNIILSYVWPNPVETFETVETVENIKSK